MTIPTNEIGFWLLVAILVFPAIQLAAAIRLRGPRRRLLSAVQSLIDTDRLNAVDKVWIRHMIARSRGDHMVVAAIGAPFLFVAAAIFGLYEGWVRHDYDDSVNHVEKAYEKALLNSIKVIDGVDAREGNFWNDGIRVQIDDDAGVIEDWNHPLAMAWICIWLIPTLPILFLTLWISGSFRPFVDNLWPPLREPVAAILRNVKI